MLLDGLDEAPDERQRELALGLIRSVAKAYRGCPLVVTSRPVAYADRTVLPGFDLSRIEPLRIRGRYPLLAPVIMTLREKRVASPYFVFRGLVRSINEGTYRMREPRLSTPGIGE